MKNKILTIFILAAFMVSMTPHYVVAKPGAIVGTPELTINPIRQKVDSKDDELLRLMHSLNVSVDITVAPGGDVQAAINSAQAGDVIILQAGAVYPLFKMKSGITVQSSRASEIVGRVAKGSPLLAKVQSSVNGESVITFPIGTKNAEIKGLDVSTSSASVVVYDIVRIGEGRATQTTVDQAPSGITVDSCYIHGWDTQDVQRGISLNGAETWVTNNYISDIHGVGFDTQAVGGWNGPGPHHIINNYLEGAGENVMFGGSDPASEVLTPSNIEIRRNYVFKPLSWQVGHPTYAGIHWTVKNLLELKNAKNVTIDGNVFENNWLDAQTGVPILFTVRNQDCSAPYSTIQHVTFTNNTVKNASGGGVNFLGVDNESLTALSGSCKEKTNPKPGSVRGDDVLLQNNLFTDIGSNFITLNGFNNVRFLNDTHPDQKGNLMTLYGDQSFGLKYKNNLTNDHQYSIYGDACCTGVDSLKKYAPDAEVTGNYIGNAQEVVYPAGNHIIPGIIPLPPDYRSPYSDGGANIDALLAAQSGTVVSLPTPSPVPSPSVSPTPAPSPSPTPVVGIPSGSFVETVSAANVREAPSKSSPEKSFSPVAGGVRGITEGACRQDTSSDNVYCKVNFADGTNGYVAAQFLRVVAAPSPTPTPIPVPTPSPSPSPSPAPVPTPSACTMTVSDATLPQWSEGKLTVTFQNLSSGSFSVTATSTSGQVSVTPFSQQISGTSAITEFKLQTKKKSSSVVVSGPCGSKSVMINVQ